MRDHLLGWRRPPLALVLGGVGVLDERDVVAAHERTVDRRADAGVSLRAGNHQPSDACLGEHVLEVGVLEGVSVRLVHERLRLVPLQLRDVLPLL